MLPVSLTVRLSTLLPAKEKRKLKKGQQRENLLMYLSDAMLMPLG
jgi:hypothetical protein